jgi:tripeptide aminopeptidase
MRERLTDSLLLKEQVIDEFCELVQIDSQPGDEAALADIVAEKLREIGMDVYRDRAGEAFGGNAGNVIGKPKGPMEGEPILLCAHLDRVAPGKGICPQLKGNRITSAGDTILAADDVAGITAILTGLRLARSSGSSVPAVEVLFTVSEEDRLKGAKFLDRSLLDSKMGCVFDASGPVGRVVLQAPSQVKFDATVIGRSAHAALNPQDGINAIQVASKAMSELPFGWVDSDTTVNIGMIRGGESTNIVCDRVTISGEARSRGNKMKAERVASDLLNTFKTASAEAGAIAETSQRVMYYGYEISEESRLIHLVKTAMEKTGRTMIAETSMGATDANILNSHGIQCVALGVGYEQVHSTCESIAVEELLASVELAYHLITGNREFT